MDVLARTVFEDAISDFFILEKENIASDISEHNLCGRLSIYLTRKFRKYRIKGYYADVEYNRKQDKLIKTILDDELNTVVIQADLIVHSRGNYIGEDNFIAIEMKKSHRPEAEKILDRLRLRAMTKQSFDGVWSADGNTHPDHVCNYKLGVYIILNIKVRSYGMEFYQRGDLVEVINGRY